MSEPSPPVPEPSPPVPEPSPPVPEPSPPVPEPSPPVSEPSPPVSEPSPPVSEPSPPVPEPSPPVPEPSPPVSEPSPPVPEPSPPVPESSPKVGIKPGGSEEGGVVGGENGGEYGGWRLKPLLSPLSIKSLTIDESDILSSSFFAIVGFLSTFFSSAGETFFCKRLKIASSLSIFSRTILTNLSGMLSSKTFSLVSEILEDELPDSEFCDCFSNKSKASLEFSLESELSSVPEFGSVESLSSEGFSVDCFGWVGIFPVFLTSLANIADAALAALSVATLT